MKITKNAVKSAIFSLAVLFACQALAVPSLSNLAATGVGEAEGGKISLGMLSSRDGFGKNKLKQLLPAEKGENDKEGNTIFAKGPASFALAKEALTLKTFGRTSGEERYEWAPVILFQPKAPGLYALSGTLAFNDSLAGKNVRWLLIRIFPDNRFEVILEGRAANKTNINLAEETDFKGRPLSAIELAVGERLGLTAWHDLWYNGGGFTVTGLDFTPGKPASIVAQKPVPKPPANDQDVRYPDDSGFVDVTQPPYNARGDGVTDDTDALQRAMSENSRGQIFLPKGTYLVSRQLRWMRLDGQRTSHLYMRGENRDQTIIKLRDHCPRFRDTDNHPNDDGAVAVIRTESDSGPPDAAIENHIHNLTVDTGRGNPGAIGISFLANNIGSVENVTIRSGDGQGLVGLSMIRIPGPCLVKNVRVEGFQFGVRMHDSLYSVVCDVLDLENQTTAGIFNDGGMLTIHKLRSKNTVPALINQIRTPEGKPGEATPPPVKLAMTQLVDAKLEGGAADQPAIINTSWFYAADVTATGYQTVLRDDDVATNGLRIEEYTPNPTLSLFDSPKGSLRLPIEETPVGFHTNDFSQWAKPQDYAQLYHYLDTPAPNPKTTPPLPPGTTPIADSKQLGRVDATEAIQAALDSGKPIVYLPRDKYVVTGTLHVPATVRHIYGMRSAIQLIDGPSRAWDVADSEKPLFRIEGETDKPVVVEFLLIDNGTPGDRNGVVAYEQASPRTFVIRHSNFHGYRSTEKAGTFFYEDGCAEQLRFLHAGQKAFIRQINPEQPPLHIVNNGAQVWILGLKIENDGGVIKTIGGGQTEMIGAFLRPSGGYPMDAPAFEIVDSDMSLISCSMTWSDPTLGPRLDRAFHYHVRETRNGVTRDLTRPDLEKLGLIARSEGVIPLFTGYADRDYKPTPVPYVPEPREGVHAPWHSQDIGQPVTVGEARFFSGGALLNISGDGHFGGGAESTRIIGGQRDACHFLACPLPADGTAVVRIDDISQRLSDLKCKVGLMLREKADDDASANVFVGLHLGKDKKDRRYDKTLFQQRAKSGADTTEAGAGEFTTLPVWLKLQRKGTEVTGSTSSDGENWKSLGTVNAGFSGPASIGVVLAAEINVDTANATLYGLKVTDGSGKLLAGPAPSALPAPWLNNDTAPTVEGRRLLHPGSASFSGGTFRILGSGWFYPKNSRDYFHYVYQPIGPDEQLVVHVAWDAANLPGKLPVTASAGLALRNDPDRKSSVRASLTLTPRGLTWDCKGGRGDGADHVLNVPMGGPAAAWLKLARHGKYVFGYSSADGKEWTLVSRGMLGRFDKDPAYLGFLATSGNLLEQTAATFDHVILGPSEIPEADMKVILDAEAAIKKKQEARSSDKAAKKAAEKTKETETPPKEDASPEMTAPADQPASEE